MVRKYSYKPETRIEAAKLFDAGFGAKSIATALQVDPYTARDWLVAFKQDRLIILDSMSKNKIYSTELKLAAVEKFLAGASKSSVVQEFQISTYNIFNRWVVAYRNEGPEGLKPKPKGRRKRNLLAMPETDAEKIYRLEMENAVLKKFLALRSQAKAAQQIKR